jgi:hypothetical protein
MNIFNRVCLRQSTQKIKLFFVPVVLGKGNQKYPFSSPFFDTVRTKNHVDPKKLSFAVDVGQRCEILKPSGGTLTTCILSSARTHVKALILICPVSLMSTEACSFFPPHSLFLILFPSTIRKTETFVGLTKFQRL